MTYIYRPGAYNVTDSGRARIAQPGGVATPWYRAGGAPLPVAAYQPKGAATYAIAKQNISLPGTHDLFEGIIPGWNSADGFIFTGSQWLDTDITPANGYTAMVQFANATTASFYALFGTLFNGARFNVYPNSGFGVVYGYGSLTLSNPGLASGNLGICGGRGYRNGFAEGAVMSFTAVNPFKLVLGARRSTGGAVGEFAKANISAFVIYSVTLTAAQVAAVSAAMAAL